MSNFPEWLPARFAGLYTAGRALLLLQFPVGSHCCDRNLTLEVIQSFYQMGSRLERITDWKTRAELAKYRVADLARSLNVTPRQLERYFLKTRDTHPKQWMMDLRMSAALELRRSGLSDKEIAARLGFRHASDFSRAMRQYRGARKSPRPGRVDI